MKEKFLKEIDKIDKEIEQLRSKKIQLKEDLLKYRLQTLDYLSQDDLKNMKNQRISIEYILDSNFKEVFIPDDEGVYIRNGYLDSSSFRNGLLYFSENDNSYIYCYHGCEEKLDIKYIFLNISCLETISDEC